MGSLHQLDPVAERVVDIDAIEPLQRFVAAHDVPGARERPHQLVKRLDHERGMRLGGGPEIGLDAEVDTHRLGLEPAAASLGEVRWLGHLGDTEEALVEVRGAFLAAWWHGQLHMVDTAD